jgi:ribonuclease-3
MRLYKLALRHSSMVRNRQTSALECNERLEFLGDAVLGMIVAEQLYKLYPMRDEGFLTEMRSKIVNRNSLSGIARKMGLQELMEYDQKSLGPVHSASRSMGGDALEALIGALYLDHGFAITKRFVMQNLLSSHFSMNELEFLEFNPKSRLMEIAQKQKWPPLEYVTTEEVLEGRNRIYKVEVRSGERVLGIASDIRKKIAEQKASEAAIITLNAVNATSQS